MSRVQLRRRAVAAGLLGLAVIAVVAVGLHWAGRRPAAVKPAVTLRGHQFPVQAVAFGPDGVTLTSAAYFEVQGGKVELIRWDLPAGDAAATSVQTLGDFPAAAFAPGGDALAAAGGGDVWLWDVRCPE